MRPDLLWYNPNIHPYTEYRSRRDSLAQFARDKNLPLIAEDEYGLRVFIKGAEAAAPEIIPAVEKNNGGRCAFCYRLRLAKTASIAAEKSYDAFSTTLLISPYQNHELIKQVGEEWAAARGGEFLYRDFRPLFREGQRQAREASYYMQKYCGCVYSEEERYLAPRAKRAK
jgi:predicted adenine nucleotide alpha hydrolase (AANH) superfamily ATPase